MRLGLNTDLRELRPERPPVLLVGGLNLVRALGLAGIPAIVAAFSATARSRRCTASTASKSRRSHSGRASRCAPKGAYFINPGSVDASRKREHKSAELAILDGTAWTVEFLRVSYDAAATEAKAAAFGYRITPWTDRLYTLRRKLFAGASRARWRSSH
jgi:hypothetical protein